MTGSQTTTSLAESPWTWAALFLVGAFVALGLAQHKFRYRQTQLERQFFARQQSGHAVPVGSQPDISSGPSPSPIITLAPLHWLLTGLVVAASLGFWWSRWKSHRASVTSGDEVSTP